MKRIMALTALTCALGLSGCDAFTQMGQMVGIVGSNWRPVTSTGYVTGRVLDRYGTPLGNALVSNGASASYSAIQDKTVTVASFSADTNVTSTGQVQIATGGFVLDGLPNGTQYITAMYDGKVSSTVPVSISNTRPADAGDIMIPVGGPVPDGSTALRFLGLSSPSTITLLLASGSVIPTYQPSDDATLVLQTPPNGAGLSVQYYNITYYDTSGNQLNTGDVGVSNPGPLIPLTNPTVVSPGSRITSGPKTNVDVLVSASTTAFLSYLNQHMAVVAQVELYDSNKQLIKDRNGNPIATTIQIEYQNQSS